jgi:hypothetical protein
MSKPGGKQARAPCNIRQRRHSPGQFWRGIFSTEDRCQRLQAGSTLLTRDAEHHKYEKIRANLEIADDRIGALMKLCELEVDAPTITKQVNESGVAAMHNA